MAAADELVEALTNAGLTWGRPATRGFPEFRVKNRSGVEITIRVLKFSYLVTVGPSWVMHQRITVAEVLETIRQGSVE
jgi:hypothetical protein